MFEAVQQSTVAHILEVGFSHSVVEFKSVIYFQYAVKAAKSQERGKNASAIRHSEESNVYSTAIKLCRSFEHIEKEPAASVVSPRVPSAFLVF